MIQKWPHRVFGFSAQPLDQEITGNHIGAVGGFDQARRQQKHIARQMRGRRQRVAQHLNPGRSLGEQPFRKRRRRAPSGHRFARLARQPGNIGQRQSAQIHPRRRGQHAGGV